METKMIRRTASEVLRGLEARVARLEGRTAMFHPDDPRSQEMGGYEEPVGYDYEPPSESEMVQRLAEETVSTLRRGGIRAEIKNNVLIIYGVCWEEDFFKPWQEVSDGYTATALEDFSSPLLLNKRRGRIVASFISDWSPQGKKFNLDPNNRVEIKERGRVRSLHIPLVLG